LTGLTYRAGKVILRRRRDITAPPPPKMGGPNGISELPVVFIDQVGPKTHGNLLVLAHKAGTIFA